MLWIWAKYCDINSALPTVAPKKKNAEVWIGNTYTNDILIPVGLPPNGMIRPVLALLTHAHLVACVAGRDRELPFLTFAEAGGVEAGIEEVLEQRVVELMGESATLKLVHKRLQHEIRG